MRTAILFCCGGLLALQAAWGAERYEGLARERGGGALVYREVHWLFGQPGERQHLVLYRCADGAPFARKLLRASPSPETPDVEFVDGRDGYREGVRSLARGEREVFVQASRGAPVETRRLSLPAAGAVIDAGFDDFVRAHWQSLAGGQAATVRFLVPSRFEFLPFRVAGARDAEVDGQPVRRLRLKLAAWYGFALPGIDLAYEPDGQRLVAFQGIGTIRDSRQRHLDVDIVFPRALRVPDVPDSEARAAMTQPLAARCPGGVL